MADAHDWIEDDIRRWEARLERASKALELLYGLRQLKQEEELEKQAPGVSKAESVPVGPGTSATLPTVVARLPIPTARRSARDQILDLLKEGGNSIPGLANAIGITAQGISNALVKLEEDGLVVREEASEPGLRYVFRLPTDEERAQARDDDAAADAAIEAALD